MTRWWTASCLFSLLVLSGGTALAQDEQSADNSTETTEPKANSDDASKAKTDGQTTVAAATGEQDQDDGKAGAPKDGTKAKADGQATAAATATVDAEDKKKQAEADATAVLGAAAPTPPPSPYQLFLTLGFQVGTGSFIPASNRDLVGYSLNFSGLYRLSKLGDGRLDVFGVFRADQSLTESSQTDLGSVGTREFFFRDIRLGLLGRSLINSKSTGLIVGANTSIDLPTGVQAQAQGRFLRWNISGNLSRIFSEVGPGSLLVRLVTTARWDFGDGALVNTTNAALCNSVSVDNAGNCLSGRTGTNFGFIPGVSLTYLVGSFNFALGISFINQWLVSASGSLVPERLQAGDDIQVGRSQNALNNTNYILFTSANISATYTASRNLLFTLGLSTVQGPVDKCNQDVDDLSETGQCVRFPFFDFTSQTNNLSTVFLNTTLMY